MHGDDRTVQIGLDEVAALVLESVLECASRDSRLCEDRLDGFAGDVRKMLDVWRTDPDKFNKMLAQGGNAAYERLLKAVKAALAKRGITATRHDPITGRPNVEKTGGHNQRMTVQSMLSSVRAAIQPLDPSLLQFIPENADDKSRLMKPETVGGVLGLKCQSVGELTGRLAALDGRNGLAVRKTGSTTYGFEPYTFVQTDWFITLADGAEDGGQDTVVAQ